MIARQSNVGKIVARRSKSPLSYFAVCGIALVAFVCIWIISTALCDYGDDVAHQEMGTQTSAALTNLDQSIKLAEHEVFREKSGKEDGYVRAPDNEPDATTNSAGVVRYKNGPKFVIPPPKTKAIFTNLVDSTIAAALAIEPGEMVYLDIPNDFDKRFNEIIGKATIVDDENDDDSTKQIKDDVRDVKRKLKEMRDKGESPRQIMEKELKELGKLAETYSYFKDGLRELRQSGASAQERKDYVDAANTVLDRYSVFKKLQLEIDENIALKREQSNEK